MTIIIKYGERYVTRGGAVTGPIKASEMPRFIFQGDVEGHPHLWDKQGRWAASGVEDPRDLIAHHQAAYDAQGNGRHYRCHPSGVEAIEICRHMGFSAGNAIKYVWRLGLKDDAKQERTKALWYLRDIGAAKATMGKDEAWRKARVDMTRLALTEAPLLEAVRQALIKFVNAEHSVARAAVVMYIATGRYDMALTWLEDFWE